MFKNPHSLFSIPKKLPVSFWGIFSVLVLTTLVYLSVFNNGFTNWDDELYIFENPYLKSLSVENLRSIFSVYYAGNYHPLTMVSLAIDYTIGGTQPWIYQLTNLLLHLCNTGLVYMFILSLLHKYGKPLRGHILIAIITAGLFGLHTLQVESVAWVSERKNLLYTFFFLLSLITYLKFSIHKSSWTYILSLVLFLLSLLSKGMAVPLPLCIIAIDYFAGRKLFSRQVILEKIPYILLSLLFGLIALMAQHSVDAIRVAQHYTWFDHVVIASYGFIQYLIKLCYPFHLSAFYPYPAKVGSVLPYIMYVCFGASILLLILVGWFFRRNKVVVFGSVFFLANISIVLQLLPVGDSVMSDRYVYIPSIGFFFIFGYISTWLMQRSNFLRNGMVALLLVYGVMLSVKTYQRVGVWKDSKTLWTDAIKNFPENNDRAYLSLGILEYMAGNFQNALAYYNKVLQMQIPNIKAYSQAYVNIGLVKWAMKDKEGALSGYNTSLKYYPTYEGYYNRALLRIESGDLDSALVDLDKATFMDSFGIGAYLNRGTIYFQQYSFTKALQNFNQVIEIDSENNQAYISRGQVKQAMNDMQGALSDYNRALQFAQTYNGYISRAVLQIDMQNFNEALMDLNKALQIDSSQAEVYTNKGVVLNHSGNYNEALVCYNQAIKIDSTASSAYNGRGQVKQAMNDVKGALSDYNKALSIHPLYDFYLNRASLNFSIKDYSHAIIDLDKAIQIDTSSYEAWFNKGYIYLNIGKMHEAIAAFNKAIIFNGNDFEVFLNRAIAKFRLSDYYGSIADLDISIQLRSTGSAFYYRGISKIKLGRKLEGCEDLKQSESMGNEDARKELENYISR